MVVGQRSRSTATNCVLASLLPCLKIKVKGRNQGQRSGSRSRVKVKFWCAAVDIRGSALPSATKSNNRKFGAKESHKGAFVKFNVI